MKIKRDKFGVAVLDSLRERLKFMVAAILILLGMIIATISFAWLVCWIITGKNIYKELIELF